MRKEFVLIIVAIIAIIVSTRFITITPETLDQQKAVRFVLEDLQGSMPAGVDFTSAGENMYESSDGQLAVTIMNVSGTPSNWRVAVKLAAQPHSACPNVTLRDYSVQPSLTYPTPEQITHGCSASRTRMIFPEEAIIAANSAPEVANFTHTYCATSTCTDANDAKAWARFYGASELSAARACGTGCTNATDGFAAKLAGSEFWIVHWKAADANLFVALTPVTGDVVSVST